MVKYPIGFNSYLKNESIEDAAKPEKRVLPEAKKSVVEVYFPSRGMSFSYYNDLFDLKKGDLVYVEGKLEGKRGYVTEVNYSFKIKLSYYKKVIAVADTDIKGDLYSAGSHVISFDKSVISPGKVRSWFLAPENEGEYVSGDDKTKEFSLDDLSGMNIKSDVAARGHNYYMQNKVSYICLDGNRGYAVVEGSENYEIEFGFDFAEKTIYGLKCSCYCSGACKHEFAAMLQLKEILDCISENYENEFDGYFAAISLGLFVNTALNNKEKIKISVR